MTMNLDDEIASRIKNHCYENRQETDKKQCAKHLHELGLYYQKSYAKKEDDKLLSLLRSATLMNAAIVREPDNAKEMKKDLKELCSFILKEAGVTNDDSCLVKEAESVKSEVESMRIFVEKELEKLEKIPEDVDDGRFREMQNEKFINVKHIQEEVSSQYLKVMKRISKRCLAILGEPPFQCRFAHFGMGSLARQEITPFSDFENAIVLEDSSKTSKGNPDYKVIKEFFRWYAVVFQIVLINFGETLIPSVAIPCLNNFSTPGGDWFYDDITPSGICFDGMMPYASKSPLGRQEFTKKKHWKTELIKPVRAMAKYVDEDESVKNGYHLADLLSKVCLVSGDSTVYKEFNNEVKRIKNGQYEGARLRDQAVHDAKQYDVWKNCAKLHNDGKGNMKNIVYRSSTIMLSTLGSFFSIDDGSCFKIIENLAKQGVIMNEEDKNKLNFIIAVACEVRLRIYSRFQRQRDEIRHDDELNADLFTAVGKKTLISYFAITKVLQEEVLEIFKRPDNRRSISLMLNPAKELVWKIKVSTFLKCYDMTQNAFKNLYLLNDRLRPEDWIDCMICIGVCIVKSSKHEEAIPSFEHALSKINKELDDETVDYNIATCNHCIYLCKNNLNKHKEAIPYFEKALSKWKEICQRKHYPTCSSVLMKLKNDKEISVAQ